MWNNRCRCKTLGLKAISKHHFSHRLKFYMGKIWQNLTIQQLPHYISSISKMKIEQGRLNNTWQTWFCINFKKENFLFVLKLKVQHFSGIRYSTQIFILTFSLPVSKEAENVKMCQKNHSKYQARIFEGYCNGYEIPDGRVRLFAGQIFLIIALELLTWHSSRRQWERPIKHWFKPYFVRQLLIEVLAKVII